MQEDKLRTLLDLATKKAAQTPTRRLALIQFDDGWQAGVFDTSNNTINAYRRSKSYQSLEDALEAFFLERSG